MKSEKWALRALKGILVGYNGHTIYWIYLKDQKKVIQVKNLCNLEDYVNKSSIEIPDYNEAQTFQGFPLVDNDNEKKGEDMYLICTSDQEVLEIKKAKQPFLEKEMCSTRARGQKFLDVEKAKQSSPSCKKSQKVNNTETIPSKVTTSSTSQKIRDAHSCAANTMKTCTSRTVKLSAKAKDISSPLG